MTLKTGLMALGIFLIAVAPVAADWDPNSTDNPTNHKMHYPQLPDPTGWDVDATFRSPLRLADDFMCMGTGTIDGVHLWTSWRGNGDPATMPPDPSVITNVHLAIRKDIPATASNGYSRPGDTLWVANSKNGDFSFTYREYGKGPQGWWDPMGPIGEQFFPNDHSDFFQINCEKFRNPYDQEAGTIYWLDVMFEIEDAAGAAPFELGWKTSRSLQYLDAATYLHTNGGWFPLLDQQGQKVDLAFVITPEPATLTLLAVGGLVLARRRRRR